MKEISVLKAASIFGVSTLYFYSLLFTLRPWLHMQFSFHPALYWFITGYALFIPLCVAALLGARREGNRSLREMLRALNVRPMTKRDWGYALVVTLTLFVCSGIIMALSTFISNTYGIAQLNTTPWFMEFRPFEGTERLLLLVWLPMFFFNIVGEELLWRGYLQARMRGEYAWLLCGFFWLVFHLPFGFDLLVMLMPIIILLPYAFHKTRNTLVGIFIHAVYNGPTFILLALGILQ
ncbi:MAG TPA: CPBP family intramembrane glutamic endopeptidase [Bacteroidota bacterium]